MCAYRSLWNASDMFSIRSPTVVLACIPTRACAMTPALFSRHAIFPTHSSAAVEIRTHVDMTFFTRNNLLQLTTAMKQQLRQTWNILYIKRVSPGYNLTLSVFYFVQHEFLYCILAVPLHICLPFVSRNFPRYYFPSNVFAYTHVPA